MNDTTTLGSNERSLKLICTDGPVTSKIVVWNNLAFGMFNLCLTLATIFLNFTTIVAYMKSKVLKAKMAYLMVMMLSVNDLIVGLTSNVLFAVILLKQYSSRRTECLLNNIQIFLLLFLSGCSFKTLVVMSCERYAAICHPLLHRTQVTRKRLMKCLAFLWSLSLVGTILSWQFIAFFDYVIIPELISFNVFLVYVYARIYLANSKSSKSVIENRRQPDVAVNTASEDQRRHVMLNVRLAKSCCLAVASFVLCYLPSCIITNGAFKFEKDLEMSVIVWAETLILANSSVNSIVFFWRSRPLRDQARAVLKQVFCQKTLVIRDVELRTVERSVSSRN